MRWTIDLGVDRPTFLMEITAQLMARTKALEVLIESGSLPKATALELTRLAIREVEYLQQVYEQNAKSGVSHPPAAGTWCPSVHHIERTQKGWHLLSATRDLLGEVFAPDGKPGAPGALIKAIYAIDGAESEPKEPVSWPEPGTFKCTPQKEP